MPVTEDQLIQLIKQKGGTDDQINQARAMRQVNGITGGNQQQPSSSVSDVLRKINPVLGDTVSKMAGTVQQLAGVTPDTGLNQEYKRAQIAALTAKAQGKGGGYFYMDEDGNAHPVDSPAGMKPLPAGTTPTGIQHTQSSTNLNDAKLDPESEINTLKQDSVDRKAEADYEKRRTLMSNDLDPSRQRSGAFGVSKQVYDRGERLKGLAEQSNMQAGGADKRQMEEFAIGLNAMLSGSNTGAQQQVAALVPKTWWGGVQGIKEYLSNNPTGLEQQKFVKRMIDTVDREMKIAKQQMDRTRYSRLSHYKDILDSHKPDFEDTLKGYGMDPEDYYAWQKGGQQPIEATGGGGNEQDLSGQTGQQNQGKTKSGNSFRKIG